MYYSRYKPVRPPKKHPRRAKRIAITFGILVVIGIYSATTMLWPLQTLRAEPTAVVTTPASTVDIDWPSYGQSAVYAPGYGLLGSSGSNTPAPIASITKIVTALVVLEHEPIAADASGGTITFTPADASRYNDYLARQGTVGPVTPGRTVSQRDMLRVMLVVSANNYADSLAIWAFGSLEAYLVAANQYLAAHDLSATVVADASGFSPNSRSTAENLVRLGELALAEPVIAEAVDTEQLVVDGLGTFQNTNLLLRQDDAVAGIKTGTTDEAGSCLLYAKKVAVGSQSITIVGATLGAPNHARLAQDASQVLTTAQDDFVDTVLATKGQVFGTYNTPWGETARAVTASEVRAISWHGNSLDASVNIDVIEHDNTSPKVGTVAFTQDGETIAEADLELGSTLQGPSWWWRLSHPLAVFES